MGNRSLIYKCKRLDFLPPRGTPTVVDVTTDSSIGRNVLWIRLAIMVKSANFEKIEKTEKAHHAVTSQSRLYVRSKEILDKNKEAR